MFVPTRLLRPVHHPTFPFFLLLCSEQLGTDLPRTLGLPAVLCITGILGVLVTYAEPAITSLRPLARLVDPVVLPPFRLPRPCQVPRARAMRLALNRVGAEKVAPYLYCALMQRQELLVLCIGTAQRSVSFACWIPTASRDCLLSAEACRRAGGWRCGHAWYSTLCARLVSEAADRHRPHTHSLMRGVHVVPPRA